MTQREVPGTADETPGAETLAAFRSAAAVALAAARTALEKAEHAFAAIESFGGGPLPTLNDDLPEWVTMGQAAFTEKCGIETMTKRVVGNGLGVKREHAQWQIDMVRVRKWRAGIPYEPLIPYPDKPFR